MLTRSHFIQHASPQKVTIAGIPLAAAVKQFSTGSLGWYANGKMMIDVGGESVTVQIGVNLTVVGSKTLPAD